MNSPLTYTTTVVFADIAGSSRLYKEAGNDEANRRIGHVIQKVMHAAQQQGGVVIKTIGDEVMCHFTEATQAFEAVIAMQKIGEQTLPLRIGMAWGTVIEKEADIFGEAVNDAAAVAKIARARQIIVTENFKQQLQAHHANRLSRFDEVKLKGGQAATALYRLEWETQTATQGVAKQTVIMAAVGNIQNQLIVSFHLPNGKTSSITLTPQNVPLHIGRDNTQCQLFIDSSLASRDHCHIDYQYGKFVLVDHSTNGTYVKHAEGPQIYLRRQESPLIGKGEISLGEQATASSPFIIHFLG